MAKIGWELAGNRLSGGGNTRLNPTTISADNRVNVSSAQIGIGAGAVQNTAHAVNQIVDDNYLKGAADAATNAVSAALRYQDRVDQLEADEAVLAYRTESRSLFFGKDKGDGTFEGGFGTLERKDALDAFQGYRKGVEGLAEQHLAGRSESVRAKMIMRMHQEKEAALDRGVQHNYQQLKLHEDNVRFQEKQDILKDIELNGPAAFTNGAVQMHLDKYSSLEERSAAEEYLAKNAMFMTYNDSIEAAYKNGNDLTPAITAYKSTAQAFETIRKTLSEDVENGLQNWLEGKADSARSQAKAAHNQRVSAYKAKMDREAPGDIAQALQQGSPELLGTMVGAYFGLHKDTEKGRNNVISGIKDGLMLAVENSGAVTLTDKRQAAEDYFKKIAASGAPLEPFEMLELENYAKVDLQKKIESKMEYEDSVFLAEKAAELAAAIANKQPIPIDGNPPPNMTPKGQQDYMKMVKNYENGFKGERSEVPFAKAKQRLTQLKSKLIDNPLTDNELMDLRNMALDGMVSPDEHLKLVRLSEEKKNLSAKTQPWKDPLQWTAGKTRINESIMVVNAPEKPKSNASVEEKEEYANWKVQAETQKAAALLDLNSKMAEAYAQKKEFNVDKWWQNYLTNTINGGTIILQQKNRGGYFNSIMWDITGDPIYNAN